MAIRTAPIVFVAVTDPVGAGFVDNLARLGGNATGFVLFEYGLSGKWLELLKQITPSVMRAAVLRDPAIGAVTGRFGVISGRRAIARGRGKAGQPRDAAEIERAITTFARSSNGGLIVTGGASTAVHRGLIIKLAAQHKLPAVYFERTFVKEAGLISYGPE